MFGDFDLFPSTDEETCVILKDLHQQGCCPRCILRFLGERKPSSYSQTEQELYTKLIKPSVLEASEGETTEQTTYCAQKCPACLGVLQEFACQDFYQQVLEKVKECDYEFKDYQISLMLPATTLLRQHAVFVYLVQKYQSAYEDKEDKISTIKDVYKWSAGLSFSKLLGVPFQMRSAFDILLNLTYKPSDQECNFLLTTFPDTFRRRKVKKGDYETFSRASIQKVLGEMTPSSFSRLFACPPSRPSEGCSCDISLSHEAVFVAGRYQKYSRQLSQTPWVIDGVTKGEGSVQELVCHILLDRFRPSDHKFSSSGREDVDVRMLGIGRPFVIEMINPHRTCFSPEDLKTIQQETNARTEDVKIRDLQMVTREEVGKLKEGEEDKSKSYTAQCWCERPLTPEDLQRLADTKDLVLYQKTPIRVLHRRTLATRERTIYAMRAEPTSGLYFNLHLSTQAGTYVKEFVHSDFGRTAPSLGTLLSADCDILVLDVTAVSVDWPPAIDPVPSEVENGLPLHTTKPSQSQPDQPASQPMSDDHSQPQSEPSKVEKNHLEKETAAVPT